MNQDRFLSRLSDTGVFESCLHPTSASRRSIFRAAGAACLFLLGVFLLPAGEVHAQAAVEASVDARPDAGAQARNPSRGRKWVATWSASATPFGVGSPVAQPDLQFPLPNATTDGVVDQTVRMVVKPDLWGSRMRFRFSNVFGDRLLTFRRVTVALQSYAGNPMQDTMTRVTFKGGQNLVTIPMGEEIWSDAVDLDWVAGPDDATVVGRNLLVSVAVQGKSGAITWHGKAVITNYFTPPGSGDHTNDIDDSAYPYSSTSWYFLNAIDVMAPSNTVVVCAFGDSITDGTASTINGNDRWSNNLSRRLHDAYGNLVSVVNQGIGGNTVNRPSTTNPSAVQRLDRDVLGLSGLTHVVWLEGINDTPASPPEMVIAGYQNVVTRLHAAGVKVVGATITSALNPTLTDPAQIASNRLEDDYRKVINTYIKTSGLFDGAADMDAATLDPATGAMKPAFLPPSSIGGTTLDWLHPNRAGYQAMANSVDISIFAPGPAGGR
jgi:lysophospholipase L1-like esterase